MQSGDVINNADSVFHGSVQSAYRTSEFISYKAVESKRTRLEHVLSEL
jgi:hypothetical protein